jgi:hypothetical protein
MPRETRDADFIAGQDVTFTEAGCVTVVTVTHVTPQYVDYTWVNARGETEQTRMPKDFARSFIKRDAHQPTEGVGPMFTVGTVIRFTDGRTYTMTELCDQDADHDQAEQDILDARDYLDAIEAKRKAGAETMQTAKRASNRHESTSLRPPHNRAARHLSCTRLRPSQTGRTATTQARRLSAKQRAA